MSDDDDDALPVPAPIAALERAAAKVLIDEDDRDVTAGVAATRELARLMEAGDRDALFAVVRLICLREDLEATRRRPRRRMRR
jgi:hypothetical protein